MQTKLTFHIHYKNGVIKPIPFCIDENMKENLGDNIAIIDEYDKISVAFESNDENAILEIDSSISEIPLQLKPSDDLKVLSEAENHDSMLTPGYYGVKVITSNKTYSGLYFINSKAIEWQGLVNLRRYLENIMSGLSQNLYIQRMIGQKNVYGDENYSLNKMYAYINNNIGNVINSMENIIQSPLTDIKKEYREQLYTKNQDIKSQRWLCTKGLNKNRNVYTPDVVFEKHCFPSKDIFENSYVKEILKKILDKVLLVESSYQEIYANSIKTIKDKSELYRRNQLNYERTINDWVLGSQYKNEEKRKLTYLQQDIDIIQEHVVYMDDILMNLKKIKSILLYCTHETWLNDISNYTKGLIVTRKIFKDNRYYQIYDFYANILALEKNEPHSRKPYFPSKKTSKLFEYYSISMILNIFKDNGFEWRTGWLADNMDDELFNGEIPTNKPMILVKDDLRVEITYEKEVKTSVVNENISDFTRMSGNHYKPDIILALFNNESNKLLKAMVIEVKCCLGRNLQSNNGPSKVIEQVRNYYNFCYYDKNKKSKSKTNRDVINEIIIIYPKQDSIAEYVYDDMNISFIQIEANDAHDVSKHYGYEKLKAEIDNCLFID